jgi:succinate dehydrogenase/fumarate reductase flavoprotein subunit
MKQSGIVVTLTMAFSIMLIAVGPLGSVLAQQNTPFDAVANTTGGAAGGNATGGGAAGGNATGGGAAGGNATGGGAAGGNATTGAAEPGIGSASELESLTQDNPQALTNNTEVTDPSTGLAELQKEQTSTDPNMTTPSG